MGCKKHGLCFEKPVLGLYKPSLRFEEPVTGCKKRDMGFEKPVPSLYKPSLRFEIPGIKS
jgi:hypothetical protein